jgi:YVTN family beta-propeller protein
MKNSYFALIPCLVVLLSAALVISAQDKPGPSGYHLLTKIEVGGDGGWDYLYADPDLHRLYVSHGTKVEVIDTETDKKIAEIGNLKGIHGIAVANEFGRGFISDGRDNSVTIFDTKTNQAIGKVNTGTNPDAIIYDPASKRVFAFNGGSKNATAIDAANGNVAGTIDLGGKPEFAASNEKGMVFVNIEDKSEVAAFDSKTLAVKSHWSLAPSGEEPSGIAIDLKNHLIFSVCSNKTMVVVNTDTGKVVGNAAIGQGTDAAGFDDKDKFAFASNGEGTLTVVREDAPDKFTVVENVPTQRSARTMAFDPKTHKVYLSTAQFGPTPAPTADRPRPRPPVLPNSFTILVYGR